MLDATVVIFVESNRRPPAMRLNVIPTKNGPRGDVIIMTAMTLKSVINVTLDNQIQSIHNIFQIDENNGRW